jgi:hypothetical protein
MKDSAFTTPATKAEFERLSRVRRAQSTPKASPETRVALIASERGLTKKQMAKYWVRRRKNSKPLFNYWAFAKEQNISTDWLFDGDLRAHPRGTAPRPRQMRRLTDGDAA